MMMQTDNPDEDAPARLNPFSALGEPCSPMRLLFAPLEIAVFLPAYAFDNFHGHGSRRR